MDKITYKGEEYPVRTLVVEYDNKQMGITLGVESLAKAMDYDFDRPGNQVVDNEIYFYVEDEILELPAEEICKNHLDIPMSFISE